MSRFCYLGNMIDAGGGAEAAVTARIRSGWKKFRELAPFLTFRAPPPKVKGKVYAACIRKCMTYGSETWSLKSDSAQRLERTEMRMVRWMCGTSLREKQRGEDLLQSMGLTKITDEIRQSRLRWYGHVVRREESHWLKKAWRFEVVGPRPRGRPRKTWDETLAEDLRLSNLANVDVRNRTEWNRAIKERQRPTP